MLGSVEQEAKQPDMCDPEEQYPGEYMSEVFDDTSGEPLNEKLVEEACAEEMRSFAEMNVYEYVLRSEAERDPRGRIVGVRWVRTNKGTSAKPVIRCRLVAQEFATMDVRDDLFAGTPPLTALRLLLSQAASRGASGKHVRFKVIDVKKAFLYGEIERTLFIELPEQDPRSSDGRWVGRLRRTMYGTRDAPAAWQKMLGSVMRKLGFKACRSVPCVYVNEEKDLRVIVHVDDFLASGQAPELAWFEAGLKKAFSIKTVELGGGPQCVQEAKFLNRSLRWTPDGLEIEGDQKHAEILIKEWGLENAKAVSTPGAKAGKLEDLQQDGERPEMAAADATKFRRGVARVVYLAQDRMDLGFASKELAKRMARPRIGDEMGLKRVIRYLLGRPRCVYRYNWQPVPEALKIFTDSDWAGDVESRKSTSGGVVMIGDHLIGHWSRTQATIALSSGEAELNASVKGASEGLGLRQLAQEVGYALVFHLLGDSSAAKGIMLRTGAGAIKHLCTKQLWIQERVMSREIVPFKIKRDINMADTCTHHWGQLEAGSLFAAAGLRWRESGCDVYEGVCGYAPTQSLLIPTCIDPLVCGHLAQV